MSLRERSMTPQEWRTLMNLCRDEAKRYAGNPEHVTKFEALADKCSYREMSLLNGVVAP